MYQPILKGKKGELDAWSNVSGTRRKHVVPLFEVVAENGLEDDLRKFCNYLNGAIRSGDVLAVDAYQLASSAAMTDGRKAYSWLAGELQNTGIILRPVVHLDDDLILVRDALTVANDGVVLRIGGTDGEPNPNPEDRSVSDWCKSLGVATGKVHLLIDLESVHGTIPASQVGVALAYLAWADANGPWATVTLASGAFPSQITTVPKGQPHPIPRVDAGLWNLAKPKSPIPDLRYGDYGVRHPALPTAGFGGPLPNLRYTSDSDWIVWRESKDAKYPNSTFFQVCAGIVGHSSFKGPKFSWADQVIVDKAVLLPGDPGPGTGTEWITYGTNHHLELVVDRLTNYGAA